MIQVRKIASEEVLYNKEHSRSIGTTWQNHHKTFAKFISEYYPQCVFEIGGGAGYLEKYYNNERDQAIKWTILEPNPDPVEGCQADYEIGFFDENYKGKITDIRVIDKDGDIVAVDNKVYERTTNKALYVAFKHEFTEV